MLFYLKISHVSHSSSLLVIHLTSVHTESLTVRARSTCAALLLLSYLSFFTRLYFHFDLFPPFFLSSCHLNISLPSSHTLSLSTFFLAAVLSSSIPLQPSSCLRSVSLRWPCARTHICVCLLSVFRGPLNSTLAGPGTFTSLLKMCREREGYRILLSMPDTHTHRDTHEG